MLPQASALSFPFTVLEVVRLGLVAGFSGVAPPKEASLPEQALARVDLPGFGGRFVPVQVRVMAVADIARRLEYIALPTSAHDLIRAAWAQQIKDPAGAAVWTGSAA